MNIDHAVFTSTSTRSAQGYRIIAATRGLTATETKEITVTSPSHNSLVSDQQDAVGYAFYKLKSNRYCVCRSCHDGCEHTARGGYRVLTHILVLDESQMQSFGCNPFAVLRSVNKINATINTHDVEPTLQPITPEPNPNVTADLLDNPYTTLGQSSSEFLISTALNDGCTMISQVDSPEQIAEAILTALPARKRLECSFSIGLKFTLSRKRRMIWSVPVTDELKRITRGQKLTIVNDPRQSIPDFDRSEWIRMVTACVNERQLSSLSGITAMRFEDESDDGLNQVANVQLDLINIAQRSIDELIEVAARDWPDQHADDALSIVQRHYCLAATELLFSRILSAPDDQLRALWPALVELAVRKTTLQPHCDRLFEHMSSSQTASSPHPSPPPWHQAPISNPVPEPARMS
jgi:GTPase-associated protein 1